LDRRFNIATRAGYHCAALVHRFLGTVEFGGTLRISLGYFNEKREIEYFIESLKSIVF
ncbi:Aminotransferase class-V, partial [Thermosyntropha lipolytica DSM 11003]